MNRLKLFDLHNPGSLLSIIRELPKEWVAELKAEDLESQLMGKHRFFTENSFVNAHQNVNVYGDFYKDYMVRYSNEISEVLVKVGEKGMTWKRQNLRHWSISACPPGMMVRKDSKGVRK